jgi:hypothetical protein
MKTRVQHLKDMFSRNFIGVKVSTETVAPHLEQMKTSLGERYELFTGMKAKRDQGSHHINVVTTKEYDLLTDRLGVDTWVNLIDKITDQEFDVTLLGLGAASGGGNTEYFVVVRSESLSELRKALGLPEKDFTVTLGFYPSEVHGVSKDSVLPVRDPFLKLFGDAYYNHNKTFDFVRDMQHFDGDPNEEVVATHIGDTSATVRVGKTYYYTVSLLGDTLGISAKWQGEEKPRISDTIINRKLKNT